MTEIIKIEDLIHRFDKTIALNKVNLTVYSGEVFGLLGHNGAGKTTSIRILNGLLKTNEGSVSVMGLNPATDGAKIRSKTGVLTESHALDERFSGSENLFVHAELFQLPKNKIPEKINELSNFFDLENRMEEKVYRYSKGMKKRLAIARALMNEPEILFLDEPTEELDPLAAIKVRELIKTWSKEKKRTVYICTHNLAEAQQLCDRVAIMYRGEVKLVGSIEELSKNILPERKIKITVAETDIIKAENYLMNNKIHFDSIANENSIEIFLSDESFISTIIAELSMNGIKIFSVIPQPVSLEDIYIKIHQGVYPKNEQTSN